MRQEKTCSYTLAQGSTSEASPGPNASSTTPQLRVPLSKVRAMEKVPRVCLGEYEKGNENANSDSYDSKALIYRELTCAKSFLSSH